MKTPKVERIYRMVGQRIRFNRLRWGWTQERLAKKVGLQRTSIVNFEAGRRRILLHDVAKLARIFRITPSNLIWRL